VLRLQPPLSITTAQLDQMVGALQKVLQAVRKAA
jgi:acetylornithine/succinyldiaminopimelate/putrescine aminotransferase